MESARCQCCQLHCVVFRPWLGKGIRIGLAAAAIRSRTSSKYFSCPGGAVISNMRPAICAGVAGGMRSGRGDEDAGIWSAPDGTFTATQIELALDDEKDLLDFCVRHRELEKRALLRVFCGHQVIDVRLVQPNTVGLASGAK